MSTGAAYERVLGYWFGDFSSARETNEHQRALWWSKSDQTDAYIRSRFSNTVRLLMAHRLSHWLETPRGRLASVVGLDQFTRNMFRGEPEAFAGDETARSLCKSALDVGIDQELRPIERVFLYLPLEHSESIDDQRRVVALFEALAGECADDDKAVFEGALDYARQHLAVIERFGRFPHRNAILGRASTAEEAQFLTQPGSSF